MTHPGSGNPTWQDYPNTATPVTANTLEAIENVLDTHHSRLGFVPKRSAWAQSGATAPTGTSTLAGLVPVAGLQDAPITSTGNGAFLLNQPGVWSLTYQATTDAGAAHYSISSMSWPNGAWWPAFNALFDRRPAATGYAGAGMLTQVLTWCGYVNPDAAARPLTLTIAMSTGSTAGGCSYQFLAELQRPV